MNNPLDASDAASLIQADWHEEFGDLRVAEEIRESVNEIPAQQFHYIFVNRDFSQFCIRGINTGNSFCEHARGHHVGQGGYTVGSNMNNGVGTCLCGEVGEIGDG